MVASAALGGALVLGFAVNRYRAAKHAAAGTRVFNAYVRVDDRGHVTLIMPKVEMGQGTYTSLPMLVAEELEVDLSAISVEPAPPDPAVYGFPVDADVYGFAVDPAAHGFSHDQSTGTSLSIIQCWLPLRQAGATARVMLVQAAAKRWGVLPSTCQASRGEVIHTVSGRRLTYGALSAAAAALPVPKVPPLKVAKDFRLIGRASRRRDTPAKVNGSALFGIDARPANSAVALIALSPVQGGSVVEPLDAAAALRVSGVRQVVSEMDVIAVVADNTWAAMKGMRALAPRWNGGANATVQQAAIVADLEAAAHESGVVAAHKAAPAAATAHEVTRVEALYHQAFLAHATLEPMNCTVDWREDQCEIWVGTQAPDRAVAKLAPLGLKPEQIRVHNHLIGGGFGRRLEVDGIVLAARIARHGKGPVRVLWSREEDIQHDRYRPYYVDRLSAALDARGGILNSHHTIAGPAVSAIAGSGRGVSIQYAFGSYLAQVAQVSVSPKGEARVERVVCARHCGEIVNPDGVRAQLKGGVMFGLSAALGNEITIADGRVQQRNFNDFPSLRINEAPRVETHLVISGEAPEESVGPALPAWRRHCATRSMPPPASACVRCR